MRRFRTSHERETRLSAWRDRARELCAQVLAQHGLQGMDADTLAETIVGMFDAGARDEEVIAFLRESEIQTFGDERLAPSDRETLAKTLHRAAAEVPGRD